MRRRISYKSILGFYAVCVVGWGSYGSGRCSVLALTGVYKFLLSLLVPNVVAHSITSVQRAKPTLRS